MPDTQTTEAANSHLGAVPEVNPAIASNNDIQAAQGGCTSCNGGGSADSGAAPKSFIYALGQIEARFPRLSLEKEYAQAVGRIETKGLTDRQVLHAALSLREHRYLARQLCWVLTVQGMESYILLPRVQEDLDLLVQVLEPQPVPWINAVIGVRGPIAPPEYCNGLLVPVLAFDQIYSFDRASLIKAIPKPESIAAEDFSSAAEELFDRVFQLADNAGATDEHRALNYLTMRYSAIYSKVAEEFANNFSLDAVDATASRLSGTRKVMDIVFTFTERTVGFTKKSFVRVDVTEEFPFLVTKLSPYYDR
jgi:hypothetical protein